MVKLKQMACVLGIVFILPLLFLMSYSFGVDSQQTGIFYGIVAYVWLMCNLYVYSNPKWLNRLLNRSIVVGWSKVLSLVAIVFSGFHKLLTPGRGLVAQTGQLAFMILVSVVIYGLILMTSAFVRRIALLELKTYRYDLVTKRFFNVLQYVLLVVNGMSFVHVLLIEQLRSHLMFMLLFIPFSIFIFSVFLYQKIVCFKSEKQLNTIVRTRLN